MTHTEAQMTAVCRFQEQRPTGSPRQHVLAVLDTGALRLLIDRSEGQATRLLAVLSDGGEHDPGDGELQIKAICDQYVRQYRRDGGPLACRLTRQHLVPVRRQQTAAIAGSAPRVDPTVAIAA